MPCPVWGRGVGAPAQTFENLALPTIEIQAYAHLQTPPDTPAPPLPTSQEQQAKRCSAVRAGACAWVLAESGHHDWVECEARYAVVTHSHPPPRGYKFGDDLRGCGRGTRPQAPMQMGPHHQGGIRLEYRASRLSRLCQLHGQAISEIGGWSTASPPHEIHATTTHHPRAGPVSQHAGYSGECPENNSAGLRTLAVHRPLQDRELPARGWERSRGPRSSLVLRGVVGGRVSSRWCGGRA